MSNYIKVREFSAFEAKSLFSALPSPKRKRGAEAAPFDYSSGVSRKSKASPDRLSEHRPPLRSTRECASRLDVIHQLPDQGLQLLGDRDHLDMVDRSDNAGWIHDRDFNAAVTMLLNNHVKQ